MYNRVREYIHTVPVAENWNELNQTIREGSEGICTAFNSTVISKKHVEFDLKYNSGLIEDCGRTTVHPTFPNGKRQKRKRAYETTSHIDMAGTNCVKAAKPCHHTKREILASNGDTIAYGYTDNSSGGACDLIHTIEGEATPAALVARIHGPGYISSVFDGVADLNPNDFGSPDWFALSAKFNEATDSLMPSSFFAGEAFAEGSIYMDAVRLVIQPRKSITHFIKNVFKDRLHKKNLGEISAHYGKLIRKPIRDRLIYSEKLINSKNPPIVRGLIGAHLSTEFGVRPAIADIVSTLDAHSKVNDRLRYLDQHKGQYVPVRVKTVRKYSLPDIDPPDPFASQIYTQMISKETIGCISAMGRVREDLNEADKYRAYAEYFGLNKIVGTAWELIPFSFVVDWFTNAQERINDLTRFRLGEGPFVGLAGLSASLKHQIITAAFKTPGWESSLGRYLVAPSDPFAFSYCRQSDYTRYLTIPDTSGVVDFSALGLFHAFTLGELLFQKLL